MQWQVEKGSQLLTHGSHIQLYAISQEICKTIQYTSLHVQMKMPKCFIPLAFIFKPYICMNVRLLAVMIYMLVSCVGLPVQLSCENCLL